jgi:hypothetical protein
MGNVYFFLAWQEQSRKWRYVGLAGAVFMCVVSVSRLALLSIPVVALLTAALSNLAQPLMLIGTGVVTCFSSMAAPVLGETIETFWDKFRSARADSSRVREALGRIAIEKWQTGAPIWGHGVVDTGPHLVEFMPIGSHHTWFGLLYVKGIVGLLALAIPFLYSLFDLAFKSQNNPVARTGLSMLLILFLYTFGENLEILAYLFWPALLMIGIAFKQPSLFCAYRETKDCPSA